jgi:hypothetical protein
MMRMMVGIVTLLGLKPRIWSPSKVVARDNAT